MPDHARRIQRVCVFCGSSHGARPEYVEAARGMGAALARNGVGLVYGGGKVGLMGVIANAALAAGGDCTGVIPRVLATKELAHEGLSDLRIVATMHERKALMADLSDAFVALPGGFGTIEEFCEVLTWAQLGLHQKPCALLNVLGYFDPLLALFDHAVSERFLRPEYRSLVVSSCDPEEMLMLLATFRSPRLQKWIDRDAT